MKLYAWQPKGHGEQSFFVMAENEESARKAVNKEIELKTADSDSFLSEREFEGWGTDYYVLTVAVPGQVLMNDND